MVLAMLGDSKTAPLAPIAEPPGGMRKTVSMVTMPVAKNKIKKASISRSISQARGLGPLTLAPSSSKSITLPPVKSPAAAGPAAARPRPMLKRQFTGVGMAPAYSRENVFSSTHVAALGADGDALGDGPSRAQIKRERAAQQRAQRVARPQKLRGAHAHPPLRSEKPPWKSQLPPRTADAADAFDRTHKGRWDGAESVYFALSRDMTHIRKKEAFEVGVMELFMNRYKEPSELEGVQRFEMKMRKAKPKKPWRLEDSIWGMLCYARAQSKARAPLRATARPPRDAGRKHAPRRAANTRAC